MVMIEVVVLGACLTADRLLWLGYPLVGCYGWSSREFEAAWMDPDDAVYESIGWPFQLDPSFEPQVGGW